MKEKDIETLQHTTWRCQYHIVFAPKYRRMVIYGQIKQDIGQILRKLCEQKGVEIIEAQACPDHIHMLLSKKAPDAAACWPCARCFILRISKPVSVGIILFSVARIPLRQPIQRLKSVDCINYLYNNGLQPP